MWNGKSTGLVCIGMAAMSEKRKFGTYLERDGLHTSESGNRLFFRFVLSFFLLFHFQDALI